MRNWKSYYIVRFVSKWLIKQPLFAYNETDFIEKIANKTYEISNPVKLLSKEYNKYLNINEPVKPVIEDEIKPKIYLYNTHQTEEYKTTELLEFTIRHLVWDWV